MSADSAKDPESRQAVLPEHLRVYEAKPVNGQRTMIAGAVADQDGLNQHAFVALTDGSAQRVVDWARNLDDLEDANESRATHCVHGGDALYVLLQSDTQAPQSLSQTVLAVARLSLAGDVQEIVRLDIPGTSGKACSAFVRHVSGAFTWDAGQLRVEGEYFLLSDPERREPFVLVVPAGS